MPATYANFLITNCAVIVPVYGDPMDEVALEIVVPGRVVEGGLSGTDRAGALCIVSRCRCRKGFVNDFGLKSSKVYGDKDESWNHTAANSADVEQNKAKLREHIAKVATEGAELVVLQELHNSLYFCQVEDVDTFDLGRRSGTIDGVFGRLLGSMGLCW